MAMSAAELAGLQAGVAELLFMRADVYAEGSASGGYDSLVHSGLACLLYKASEWRQQVRAEGVGVRDFLYDPAYTLGEYRQVEVDGVRWQVVPGSIQSKALNDGVLVNACSVERAA
jgi:hypothetical protein